MSGPILELGMSCFFQNIHKDKILVSKKGSLYVACFAYRLATIILFFINTKVYLFYIVILCPKLIFVLENV
jgi:hypothetical protein